MTQERQQELETDLDLSLTSSEIAEGWHFCLEYDGLLCIVGEQPGCTCDKNE